MTEQYILQTPVVHNPTCPTSGQIFRKTGKNICPHQLKNKKPVRN